MNESAEKAAAQETEGKNRELSDEEVDAARVSGGAGGSAVDAGNLSAEEAERIKNHGWRNDAFGAE